MGLCAISCHVHCNLRRSNSVVVQSINPYWFMGMRDHFSSLNSLASMVGGAGCSPSYWLVAGRAKRPFVGRGWRRCHRRGSGDGSVLSTLSNVVDRTCLKPREAVGNHNGASIRAGIRGSADSPLPPHSPLHTSPTTYSCDFTYQQVSYLFRKRCALDSLIAAVQTIVSNLQIVDVLTKMGIFLLLVNHILR